MFARKVLTDSHLRRIVNCQVIRTIRGKIKIPVHLNERKSRTKTIPASHLDGIRKSNIGIGESVAAQMEYYGKYAEDEIDLDAIEDDLLNDLSLDDIEPKIQNLSADIDRKERRNSFSAIKRKYFPSEKSPGMLTYAEKQQIIHLHQEDPDYWDVYKLAEGFPATPEIIKKILRTKFTARSVSQILRHDEDVRKNWEAFEKGELKFNDELQKIYSSFVGRSRFITDEKEMEKFIPPEPDFAVNIPIQEFGSIIASSEKHQLEAENRRKHVDVDEQGRFVYQMAGKAADLIDEEQPSQMDHKHDTLESFRLRIDSSKKKRPLDQVIAAAEPMKLIEPAPTNKEEFVQQRKEEHHQPDLVSGTGVVSKDFNPFMAYKEDSDYPLRINIPQKLWKKNKLYRVRDCFYADDGSFLYRVPGIDRLS